MTTASGLVLAWTGLDMGCPHLGLGQWSPGRCREDVGTAATVGFGRRHWNCRAEKCWKMLWECSSWDQVQGHICCFETENVATWNVRSDLERVAAWQTGMATSPQLDENRIGTTGPQLMAEDGWSFLVNYDEIQTGKDCWHKTRPNHIILERTCTK